MATRLARLALTRLDAPCPITWESNDSAPSCQRLAVLRTPVFADDEDAFWTMAHVVTPLDQPSNYKDSQARLDRQRQNELLARSSTLYVPIPVSYIPDVG